MVYGKTQTSFRLLTEETAIKWRLPVATAGPSTVVASGGMIYAGMVVWLNATNEFVIALPTGQASNVPGCVLGIAMDDYNSSLDETQGSGFMTVVLGPHIGVSSQVSAITSVTIGQKIYIPNATAGKMDTASGSTIVCANALSCDATFLTYWWRSISA